MTETATVVPFITREQRRAITAHSWAEKIRRDLGLAGICTDSADIYNSEFRRFARLGSIHLCRLRKLAQEQVAERRGE